MLSNQSDSTSSSELEPLKPMRVHPPETTETPSWVGINDGTYTVVIELSREPILEERRIVPLVFRDAEISGAADISGSFLELAGTTLEEVKAETQSIKQCLAEVTKRAIEAKREAENETARRAKEAQEEEERLRKIAESIKFD